MKRIHKIAATLATAFGIISIIACSSTKGDHNMVTQANTTDKNPVQEKSGAQLWGETCNRCHNAPSPSDFNDTDWETLCLHMRVRANLTEEEINKIEEFLKSAN